MVLIERNLRNTNTVYLVNVSGTNTVYLVNQVTVLGLIGMFRMNKDSSSCRSGEISSGVDMNVSEVQTQSIL